MARKYWLNNGQIQEMQGDSQVLSSRANAEHQRVLDSKNGALPILEVTLPPFQDRWQDQTEVLRNSKRWGRSKHTEASPCGCCLPNTHSLTADHPRRTLQSNLAQKNQPYHQGAQQEGYPFRPDTNMMPHSKPSAGRCNQVAVRARPTKSFSVCPGPKNH